MSEMRDKCWVSTLLPAATAVLLAVALTSQAALAQYPVGKSDVTYIDADRSNRQVPVDLYYPALAAGSNQPVADPPPEGFAAASFGHGYQMSASLYAWIAERLAWAGCVVAVPRTGGELFPSHEQFGLDLAFVARTLRDADADPDSPFFGRMGPRTLVMGHSMGGGCSFLAAASDPSITAVANFAAAETNPSAIAACEGLVRPVLIFAGTNDCVTPPAEHQVPMYETLAGWRTLVTIAGASHCQFNAYSWICELGESCTPDISRQAQQDLVWLLLDPWVRAVLFLDDAAAQQYQALLETGAGFTYLQSDIPTAAEPTIPVAACRLEAFPNPFNPAIALRAKIENAGPVRLAVFDVGGRLVRVIALRPLEAGQHTFHWDGRDAAGREAPSGVYLARLVSAGGTATVKLVLVR